MSGAQEVHLLLVLLLVSGELDKLANVRPGYVYTHHEISSRTDLKREIYQPNNVGM